MELNLNLPMSVGGAITFKVLNSDGTVASESTQPWHNDVLDRFWTAINDPASFTRVYIRVGSNNVANNPAMVALQTPITLLTGTQPYVTSCFTSTTTGTRIAHPRFRAIEDNYSWVFTYSVGQLNATIREIGFELTDSVLANSNVSCVTRVVGFPDIVINATQQLVVTYNFRVFFANKKRETVFNATVYDVSTPITVTEYPQYANLGDFMKQTTSPSATVYSEYTDTTAGVAGGQSSSLASGTNPASPAGYMRATSLTVDLTQGNFAGGVKTLTVSNDKIFHFNPGLVKDADSIIKFGYRQKIVKLTGQDATNINTSPDYTIPFIDLVADTAQNKMVDNAGVVTELFPKKYICAEIHGLPAVLLPHWEANCIPLLADSRIQANHQLFSAEFIIFVSGYYGGNKSVLHGQSLFTTSPASPVSTGNWLAIGSSQITQSSWYDSSVSNPSVASFQGWCRLVVHREGTTTKLYLNGTLIATYSNTTNSQLLTNQFGQMYVLGYHQNVTDTEPQTVLLHRIRFYNNYLIPASNPLPTLLPRPNARTIALLTFESGLPVTSGDYRVNYSGTVTHSATGGPNGIPCIDSGASGYLGIASPDFQFLPTDEFTIEFDIYLNATPGVSFISLINLPGEKTGETRSGIGIDSSRSFMFPTDGSTTTGTTGLTLSTWTNIVIVRRNESGNMVTYVCKNGVVGLKMTNATPGTASRLQMSGLLNLFSSPRASSYVNAKLANFRLTRGVIEYFNPSGFTPPVGLKTVL